MWPRPSSGSARPPPPARTSFACRSCSPDSTSARARTMRGLTKPSRSPVRRAKRSPPPPRSTAWSSSARFFERRAPGLYHNTAVVFDADGSTAGMYRKMHIPDDPLYYEKFYFTPGDLGFSAFDTQVRPRRRVRLLGPVVSRGRAADGFGRAQTLVLSHGHRLAAEREGRVWREPALGLGNDDAQPRDRQRRVRGRRQPHRPRRAARILGSVVPGRSERQRAGPGHARQGRDAAGRVRPRQDRHRCARTGRSCAIGGSTPTAT